jgi:hypothetical protein
MEEKHRIKGIYGESHLTDKGLADYQAALANRRAEGRYTLEEAALEIAGHAGERPEAIIESLIAAVRAGTLGVHEPGKNARYESATVRIWYDETYWDDLNTWLASNHPRIGWKFPSPSHSHADRLPYKQPQNKQIAQEEAIVSVIKELGYDCTALPKRIPGKAGVKAAVRAKLEKSMPSNSAFDKAWERLRRNQEIKEVD